MVRLGRPLGALFACTMVAIAAAPAVAQDEAAGSDDSVRFLTAEDFVTGWDPYQHAIQIQRRIEAQLFDYLVDFPDTKGDPEPRLASEWTPIDDTTWEFTLQDGVTFHDGSPFDAEDVKASIELASGKQMRTGEDGAEVPSVSAGEWVPTAVEIVDDHTVRLVSDAPFASLFAQLGSTPIVSSEDIGEDFSGLAAAPNGTGPFKLVGDEVGKKVMDANPDYWRGAPQIEHLTWEYIQDPETRLSALLTGQADVIDRVPPQHLQQIEDADGVSLTSTTGIESVNLFVAPGRLPIWEENPSFRKAVIQAIDRDGLVNGLVQGSSKVATSFLPTETQGHVDGVPAYSKDTEAAKALLAEGGVTDGGPEFELWVASGFLPRADEVGAAIAANLEEAGLHPKIVTTDIGAMVDDIFSRGRHRRDVPHQLEQQRRPLQPRPRLLQQLRLVLRRRGAPGAHRCGGHHDRPDRACAGRRRLAGPPLGPDVARAPVQQRLHDRAQRPAPGTRRSPELPDGLLSGERDRVGPTASDILAAPRPAPWPDSREPVALSSGSER